MNWVSFGSVNGLLPIRHQAITWTNADLLSMEPLGTNHSEIRISILCPGGDKLINVTINYVWNICISSVMARLHVISSKYMCIVLWGTCYIAEYCNLSRASTVFQWCSCHPSMVGACFLGDWLPCVEALKLGLLVQPDKHRHQWKDHAGQHHSWNGRLYGRMSLVGQ